MSYRTFKKALGETNLERKCRFLFGACLLPLIAGSFWWYGSQTSKIVIENNRPLAELAVNFAMFEAHQEALNEGAFPDDNLFSTTNEFLAESIRSGNFDYRFLHPKNPKGKKEPTDLTEWALVEEWQAYGSNLDTDADVEKIQKLPKEERPWSQRSDSTDALQTTDAPTEFYQYYEPVFAKEKCIECHSKDYPDIFWPNMQIGDLIAVARVQFDMKETNSQIHANQSLLLMSAIATVTLAMIALYVIVRYVIVKPLRHLRDVSNAIRSGDVEQRASIHTGDEFEDLGAAFNRMLRQLLRQQDELREVNGELDGKIDEMAQANLRLFEMNQHKSDFLATISHELRTPLNSIIGFSDLLSNVNQLEEKEVRYANNIQRSGNQLLEMINSILDLAKIESGKLDVRLSEMAIGTIIATQCDLARPLSGKKNIDLACKIAPGLPPMLQDQGKIEQILNNLLSNAIKFTPDGGRIDVAAHRDQRGDLRLTVSDTGVGISDSEQVLVFEKFRQGTTVMPGGNAMTREYSGTGLGLSIVRELCRLLGGDITLESELGKGSTFTVYLPWALTELPKLESPLAEELKQMTKPRPEIAAATPVVDHALDEMP